MIFLSYNHLDGDIIDSIAQKLSTVFGQEKIFYDKWSVQPGDGIINKMNEGLEEASFLFFFISKNSLESDMVKLEWQNGLMKSAKGNLKLIPVKLDDCMIPAILFQNLYIDIFGQGPENGTRQIIDVINGNNTYRPGPKTYENIRGSLKIEGGDYIFEFRAETYLEPQSRYVILLDNKKEDFNSKCQSDGMFNSGFKEGLQLDNGSAVNAFSVSVGRATSPGFPFVIRLIPKDGKEIKFKGLMRAVSHNQYKSVPCALR